MFASISSFLPSALQLHSSPEKLNSAITSDFRPDNDDDDEDNPRRSSGPVGAAGPSSANEFGAVKDQKGRDKKALNETFIFVRPPPAKTNHPLNLQVQLVPPHSRGPSGLTPTSTTSFSSTAYTDTNTPVTATPARTSFDQGPRRRGTDDSMLDLSRTSTNRSDASTVYSSGYSSVSSFSSVASSASTSSLRRTIIPLYNLQAHNVMTNTIVDAGTDAKIAKFQKRGLEMIGLAMLEPVEVWPSSSTVAAQHAPSTPGTTSTFSQPRSNRASFDSRRPPHSGSQFLNAHQDKSSRPTTPTHSEDIHGHTPTSSRLSVSSAGLDSPLHHAPSRDSHHPYPSQVATPPTDGMPFLEGSSSGAKKNIFGKFFKRKGPNASTTPDSNSSSPVISPTPGVSRSPILKAGTSKPLPPAPITSPVLLNLPSPTLAERATTPTIASSSTKFTSSNNQHLTAESQVRHRAPGAPTPHERSKSEMVGDGSRETPTPRGKRQAASFNLPGFINKGSALIARGANAAANSKPPAPPPLMSEDSTITAGNSSRPGEVLGKRDSGMYGPVTPTDSSGSINCHNPPTPTPASQPMPAPAQALRPPVLGIQPSLSIVPNGSKAASNAKSNRATMYVWIVRRWFKGSDNGLLGNLGKIGNGVIGLGIGKEEEKRKSAIGGSPSVGYDANWNMFEVRFEWKRGKGSKGKKKKDGGERLGRGSVVIGNPPAPRERSRTDQTETRRPTRVESKSSLRASAEGRADETAGVDASPREKASKRLSLLSQKTTSTKTSDEHIQRSEKSQIARTRSRPRPKDDVDEDGYGDEDDGEESDPEDSETPWTCTLKVKRLPTRATGDTMPSSGSGLLAPLTLTTSRSPRSSAYSRNSLDLQDPMIAAEASGQSQTLKLKLGTLSPTPHHPKVVAMLKVPFPLPDVEVERMSVRKRTVPGVQHPPSRPVVGMGVGGASADTPVGLELTAEELKDVVCSTGMWLVVREGFGGVGKERRRGDGWRIRA